MAFGLLTLPGCCVRTEFIWSLRWKSVSQYWRVAPPVCHCSSCSSPVQLLHAFAVTAFPISGDMISIEALPGVSSLSKVDHYRL